MATDDLGEDIVAAETRRTSAMLTGDAAALDAILDDRLVFAHATGAIDDKSAYLSKMAAGRIEYRSIEWPEQRVIALADDAALLSGMMVTQVRVDGVEKRLDNRVLSAWSRTEDAWRMIAFQSTPMKG